MSTRTLPVRFSLWRTLRFARGSVLASCVAGGLLLSACGGGGSAPTPEAGAPPTQAPTITAMVGDVTSLTVTWGAVADAESYAVYLAAAQGIAPSTYRDLAEGQLVTGLVATQATISGLTPGATYWCVVAARNSVGEGPVGRSASVPLRPVAVANVSSLPGNQRMVMEWLPARGAATYDVYLASDASVSSSTWQSLPGGRRLTDVSSPLEVTGLANESTTFALVVARNPSGTSPDSPATSCVPTARGAFEEVDVAPVGLAPQAALTADFDGDGVLDLATADRDAGTVSVLRGLGDGTFGAAVPFTVGAGPVALAAADVNLDGWIDLACANSLDDTVSVLLADGLGGFLVGLPYPVGAGPVALCFVELRAGSGLLDLAVVAGGAAQLDVLPGLGDGSFDLPSPHVTGAQPTQVLCGDVNLDGFQDLLTLDRVDATISCFLGDGFGALAARVVSTAGATPSSLVVVDLDGDPLPDLLVTDLFASDVLRLRGVGDGSFAPLTTVATGPNPSVTLSADLDGDGNLDLIVLHAGLGHIRVLLGDGLGGYTALAEFAPGGGLAALVLGDFDRDGVLDLAVSEPTTGSLRILRGVSPTP